MLELTIRFLSGRYHATGWDHHVNEGTVEWPPSPWRLLRALVAASHRMPSRPTEKALENLLAPLAAAPPLYTVPPYSEGHTRHFMPLDNKGLPEDKSALIYDAFVAPGSGADTDDGELSVVWPDAEIDDSAFELLSALCQRLSYLGRAESWAEIRPTRTTSTQFRQANCRPVNGEPQHETVRLMTAAPPSDHAAWYSRAKAAQGKPKSLPNSLIEILSQDTGELRRLGWSNVPGTRWTVYDHQRMRLTPARRTTIRDLPHVALYRIDGPVRPRVRKTLQVGEVLHRALVAQSRRVTANGEPLSIFTGERPAHVVTGDHAAVMPVDLSGDGYLDHALVTARRGFDRHAIATLRRVRRLYGVGTLELMLTVVGAWSAREIEALPSAERPAPLGKSKRWRSFTPYILTRHPKITRTGHPRLRGDGTWRDGPEDQLRKELSRLIEGVEVTAIRQIDGPDVAWYRFQRERHHGGGSRSLNTPYGFDVEFAAPVTGPIAAGYGRFFGLGQFVPV